MKTIRERFYDKINQTAGCWHWIGAKEGQGYGQLRVGGRANGKLLKAHRISYELHIGPIPPGLVIDHKCRVKACVNPEHLRAITQKQNTENRSGARSDSKTGVWGVHQNNRTKKWFVSVRHHGVDHSGGTYTTLEEAAEAAKALRLRLFTHNDKDRAA